MNKKVSIGALITLMAIVAAVTFCMTYVYSRDKFDATVYNLSSREAMYKKLSEIDKRFRTSYAGQIDEAVLQDSIASGYVKGTGDAYARYFTREAFLKETQLAEGRLAGIGVLTEKDASGYLAITEVYAGSTAESAGLRVGDLIVKIGEDEIKPENIAQLQEQLQGEAGTKIDLVVRRENDESSLSVTRRYVEIPSVFPQMLEDDIGYLRVANVLGNTDEQFRKQLEKLIDQGAKSILLDLRDNSGGNLDCAIKILDRILPAQQVLVATPKNGVAEFYSTTDSKELKLPIVVLTSEKTAREAEIIAQVLRDFGKAKTVGAKTLGRGTKQDAIKLSDGSAILVTTAVYKTPQSDTFNLVGVKPDYEVKLSAEEEKNAKELTPQTDPQIKKAVEVAQGLMRADKTAVENAASSQPPQNGQSNSSQAAPAESTPGASS